MQQKTPKIGLVSLGCAKNLVDSQRLTSVLVAMGYRIENEYSKCDVVVVNTCGFIGPAVEESMQAIGEALNYARKVIVTGCLGARAKLVMDRYPQVAAVYGPGMRNLVKVTDRMLVLQEFCLLLLIMHILRLQKAADITALSVLFLHYVDHCVLDK